MSESLWYKDAVIYELHVKAFCDSERRRHRRLPGPHRASSTTSKTWASTASGCCPCTRRRCATTATTSPTTAPSTRSYGTLDDFRGVPRRRARARASASSPSWCSTTPPTSTRGSRRRAARATARGATTTSGATPTTATAACASSSSTPRRSNWAWDPVSKPYYWHRFFSHQPDLNYDNPAVREEIWQVMQFWLEHGRRRLPRGRRALPGRARRHDLREPARDPRGDPRSCARAHRRRVPGPDAAGRGQHVARGRAARTSATATSSTWRSTSR